MNKDEIFRTCEQKASGTVLSFEERGPWGSSQWRGNFSGWIPASLIYRYGANSVSEIFAGGGTTSDLFDTPTAKAMGFLLPAKYNIMADHSISDRSQCKVGVCHHPS